MSAQRQRRGPGVRCVVHMLAIADAYTMGSSGQQNLQEGYQQGQLLPDGDSYLPPHLSSKCSDYEEPG